MELHSRMRPNAMAIMLFCLLIACILALPDKAHANGTTYYVDAVGGNDSNNGQSASSAWQSLAKVNSTTFQPGDQVLFAAGNTWNGQLHPQGSGSSSGGSITIGMYGSGNRPVINGGGGVADAVYLDNQQYWTIQDLEVTNESSDPNASLTGVHVTAQDAGTLNNISILNMDIHDVDGSGASYSSGGIVVDVNGSSVPTHWNNVLIQGNTINNVSRVGISTFSTWVNRYGVTWGQGVWTPETNVTIQNNTLSNIAGDGILPYVTSGVIVQHNTVANASQHTCQVQGCNQASVAIWTGNSDNSLFQYNEVYGTGSNQDGQAFDCDLDNNTSIWQYNYSHDNAGGFMQVDRNYNDNCIVRYNISQNDQRDLIDFGYGDAPDATDKFQAYNNTFYIGSGISTDIIGAYGNSNISDLFYFTNNIVYNLGSGGYTTDANAVYDHNVFYGNHPSTEPSDANKLTSDPLLANPGSGQTGMNTVNGYFLQNGSPALNSGTVISNNGGQDYYGNPVSSSAAPNRGAYNGAGVAASTSNLVSNPGFESGNSSSWNAYSGASVVASHAHSGSYALQTGSSNSGAEQVVTGLASNTTYTLTAWGEVANAGEDVYIGVKNYGGTETNLQLTGTSYSQAVINFTTGSSNSSADIYCYKAGGSGAGYCDDFVLQQDLVSNPGFESGSSSSWNAYSGAAVVASNAHSGTYALQTGSSNSGAEQVVTGLSPNTTYTLSGWGEVANAGEGIYIGVKNYGGTETALQLTSTSYSQATLTFTTGSSNSSADIYCYKAGGSGAGYCDDLSVTQIF